MHRYNLEFVLNAVTGSADTLQHALGKCGENVEIVVLPQSGSRRECNFKIHIHTADPTIVFDLCAQYGRIKSVKVEESS